MQPLPNDWIKPLEFRSRLFAFVMGPCCLIPGMIHHFHIPVWNYVAAGSHWLLLAIPMSTRRYFPIVSMILGIGTIGFIFAVGGRYPFSLLLPGFTLTSSVTMLWNTYSMRAGAIQINLNPRRWFDKQPFESLGNTEEGA